MFAQLCSLAGLVNKTTLFHIKFILTDRSETATTATAVNGHIIKHQDTYFMYNLPENTLTEGFVNNT